MSSQRLESPAPGAVRMWAKAYQGTVCEVLSVPTRTGDYPRQRAASHATASHRPYRAVSIRFRFRLRFLTARAANAESIRTRGDGRAARGMGWGITSTPI